MTDADSSNGYFLIVPCFLKTSVEELRASPGSSFQDSPGKTDLHICVPAAFSEPEWGKISDKNRHDLRAFGGGYTRCNSALFWQTEQK
jgi:hypothetical protein